MIFYRIGLKTFMPALVYNDDCGNYGKKSTSVVDMRSYLIRLF